MWWSWINPNKFIVVLFIVTSTPSVSLATGAAPISVLASALREAVSLVAFGILVATATRYDVGVANSLPCSIIRLIRAAKGANLLFIHNTLYISSILASIAARDYKKRVLVLQHIGPGTYIISLRTKMQPLKWSPANPLWGVLDQANVI